jgi:hypothetical protein
VGPEDVSESQKMDSDLEKQPGFEGGDQERDPNQQDGVLRRAEERKTSCHSPGGGGERPPGAAHDKPLHTTHADAHTGKSVDN